MSAIILVFGIFAVYEITKRLKDGTVVENDRMGNSVGIEPLSYIVSNGKKRRVPEFSFLNQDSIQISNKDYFLILETV